MWCDGTDVRGGRRNCYSCNKNTYDLPLIQNEYPPSPGLSKILNLICSLELVIQMLES